MVQKKIKSKKPQKKRSNKPKTKATQKQKQKQNVKVVVQGGGQGGGVVPIPMPSYDHANTSNSYMMMNLISKVDDTVSRIGRTNIHHQVGQQVLGDPVNAEAIYEQTQPNEHIGVYGELKKAQAKSYPKKVDRQSSGVFEGENPMGQISPFAIDHTQTGYENYYGRSSAIPNAETSSQSSSPQIIPKRRGRPLGKKDSVPRRPKGSGIIKSQGYREL